MTKYEQTERVRRSKLFIQRVSESINCEMTPVKHVYTRNTRTRHYLFKPGHNYYVCLLNLNVTRKNENYYENIYTYCEYTGNMHIFRATKGNYITSRTDQQLYDYLVYEVHDGDN